MTFLFSLEHQDAMRQIGMLCAVALVAWVAVRWPLTAVLPRVARRTPSAWDDLFIDRTVLERLAILAPLVVLSQGISLVDGIPSEVLGFLRRILLAGMVLAGTRLATAVISAALGVYEKRPIAQERPLKGIAQVAMLVSWGMGLIVVVASLADRSPWYLISGLGAATAVIMLVFRDTILSLVAGMQLIANRLVRVGDWLEMPQFGADGAVVEIALNTVSVRNWDNTITVIPAHSFLSHSFKNWRGMQESGGRRIKRTLLLDMTSVRHCTEEELSGYTAIAHLRPWLETRRRDIACWNRERQVVEGLPINGRRLTNLGCFRAYALAYLRQHPGIRQDQTLLVRHLDPGPHGLPVEIYCFTTTTEWCRYEEIQADLMDHFLASLRFFALSPAQAPTVASLQQGELAVSAGVLRETA